MKNLHYALLLLLIITIVVACNKEEKTITVSGKVMNPNNQKGIEDAAVTLEHKPVSSSVYNAGYQYLTSSKSDGNGSFSLSYEKTRSSDYRIRVNKDNYFRFEKEYPPEKFESETDISMSFSISPIGYVRTAINNISSFDQNDHIIFQFLNMEPQCSNCCPSGYIHGYGQYYDTLFVCAAPGGKYLQYEYSVTLNNSTNLYGPDSVYIQSFDTTLINIDY